MGINLIFLKEGYITLYLIRVECKFCFSVTKDWSLALLYI